MFNERMLNIIRFLKKNKESTYREIAENLGVSERSVRYDVGRINDILSLEHLPELEKHSKGVVVYPEGLDLKGMEDKNGVLYNSKERMSIILLLLMIRKEDLRISQLSRQFGVSRTTVKNDMAMLDAQLRKEDMGIGYSNQFYLTGSKLKRTVRMNQEFRKYIEYLIGPFTEYGSYEFYCIHIIHKAYRGVSIPGVVMAVNELLKELNCTLTTNSYFWYVSNVVVLVWYILHDKVYPLDVPGEPEHDKEILERFRLKLEDIIHTPVSAHHIAMMARMLDCTNKMSGESVEVDPVHAQTVTYDLIFAMSRRMEVPFERDKVLAEGLLNHMIPLLQRISSHVSIRDDVVKLLHPEERQLYRIVSQACTEVEDLRKLNNEDELAYLTICFMASIRRMKAIPYKKILLVCGHGYGTTTMLKESLLSEYQIHILDTLPVYQLPFYQDWASIDYVFSTIPIKNDLPKPCLTLTPLLQPEDRAQIEKLGVIRKVILPGYHSIEEKLSFLDEETRQKVMNVIRKELGYQTVSDFHNPKRFSSLLKYDCIRRIRHIEQWQEAVRLSAGMLVEREYTDSFYIDDMIGFMEEKGFYSVTDGAFALLHAKSSEHVRKTALSLLVTEEPVVFGEKKVSVIFCLASADTKEHIPAVITLTRMVKMTDMIRRLEQAETENEIYQIVLDCEFEIS